jgi:Tfp pilus assembly protein PilO
MTAAAGQMTPKLVMALEDIVRWRQESDADADREHNEITEEQARLDREITERQQSLAALATRKSEVEGDKEALPAEQLQRRREVVLKNLAGDRGLLAARGSLYGDQVKARERRVQDLIEKPQYNKLVTEYEEFQDVEMGLASLPKTYRQAILAHHSTVKAELAPVFDAMSAEIEPVDAQGIGVAIVGSIDAPDGAPPEALAIIIPTPFEACSKWSERAEDLASLIAYRVISCVGKMLHELGAADAPFQYAEYENALAIQVWLGDSEIKGNIARVLDDLIDEVNGKSAEFEAGRLRLEMVWVDPEVVAPDDHADGGEA